jgi:hypothetical protein
VTDRNSLISLTRWIAGQRVAGEGWVAAPVVSKYAHHSYWPNTAHMRSSAPPASGSVCNVTRMTVAPRLPVGIGG